MMRHFPPARGRTEFARPTRQIRFEVEISMQSVLKAAQVDLTKEFPLDLDGFYYYRFAGLVPALEWTEG